MIDDFEKFLDECVEEHEKESNWVFDCIVYLRYRYDHEKDWTYAHEILTFNGSKCACEWLNDWYEGQQHVEYIGMIPIDSIPEEVFWRPREDYVVMSNKTEITLYWYCVEIIEIINDNQHCEKSENISVLKRFVQEILNLVCGCMTENMSSKEIPHIDNVELKTTLLAFLTSIPIKCNISVNDEYVNKKIKRSFNSVKNIGYVKLPRKGMGSVNWIKEVRSLLKEFEHFKDISEDPNFEKMRDILISHEGDTL